MVTKKKGKSRVNVGKLKLNKETVKSLSSEGAKKVKGGLRAPAPSDPNQNKCTAWCVAGN